MRIAVLGTGMVAHTLGGAWKKAGHDVVLGARDVADDPDFQVLTLQEAIVTGELVVNAITGSAALEHHRTRHLAMAGKTLLDATNALTETNELLYRTPASQSACRQPFRTCGWSSRSTPRPFRSWPIPR